MVPSVRMQILASSTKEIIYGPATYIIDPDSVGVGVSEDGILVVSDVLFSAALSVGKNPSRLCSTDDGVEVGLKR